MQRPDFAPDDPRAHEARRIDDRRWTATPRDWQAGADIADVPARVGATIAHGAAQDDAVLPMLPAAATAHRSTRDASMTMDWPMGSQSIS